MEPLRKLVQDKKLCAISSEQVGHLELLQKQCLRMTKIIVMPSMERRT
jgi:hypothetical protein